MKFLSETWSRAEEPLGLVHSDLCGKISSPSLSHAEYFIDDKTHYVWIYVVKHKHEVFEKFVEWKSLVEKSSDYKVKKLRTNSGGEYTSTEFESYLKQEGIEHQCTIPKTPEQNGVAKGMNRTLVETFRTMLADSRLTHRFWAEALSTAAYLINRSPTKTLGNKTPFEVWYGKKPNVNHLRVFRCSAYIHVPKDERRKLDPKAKKCIFLGYGTSRKGYRLYDQKTSSIIHSRDVVFNESSRKYGCEEEKRLIQVENNTEEEPEAPKPEEDSGRVESGDDDSSEPERDDDLRESDREDLPVPQRTSTRVIHKPDYYGVQVSTAAELQKEPQTVTEALNFSEKEHWEATMQKELSTPTTYGIWWSYLKTENQLEASGYSRRKPRQTDQLSDTKLG